MIPFCASTEVSLPRGGQADVAFDMMRLKARRWTLIDELRFCINPQGQPFAAFPSDFNGWDFGGIVNAQIKVGRHYIASDFVPLWMLSSRWNLRSEFSSQTTVTSAAQAWVNLNHLTWKFRWPMLVAPDTVIGIKLQRPTNTQYDPATLVNPFIVESTISGLQLEEAPRSRKSVVPYITNFVVPARLAASESESGEYPLRNPFTKPLNVERLVVRSLGNDPTMFEGPRDLLLGSWAAGTAVGKNTVRIRLQDSDHYDIANQPERIGPNSIYQPQYLFYDAVFQAQNSSLVEPFTLEPKQWLNVKFVRSGRNFDDAAGPFEWDAQPMLSMVGSRPEAM